MKTDVGGPTVRLTATHLVLGPNGAGDALAIREDGARVFVPGPMPCGECSICRRGLAAACQAARVPFSRDGYRNVEVAERFVTPINDPKLAELTPLTLIGAGLVAELMDATARTGLGPGETAIWIGAAPWTHVGAAWTARRGCRAFLLRQVGEPGVGEGVVELDASAAPTAWSEIIGTAEAASGTGAGRPERRIYVYGRDSALARAAFALAVPGATVSFLQGAPAAITGFETAPLRILIGGGYHPDLIPEALAALARGEVDVSGALREVDPSQADEAIRGFASGLEHRRLPVLRLD